MPTRPKPLADADVVALAERLQATDANELALLLLAAMHPGHTRAQLAAVPVDLRDAQLLRWRAASFGDRLQATASCPACGERLQYDLSARVLLAEAADDDAATAAEPAARAALELPFGEHRYRLRRPDSDDVAAALDLASAQPAASADEAIDAGVQALLLRCLAGALQPGHEAAALADAFGQALVEAAPLVDPQIALQCPACGVQWAQALDIACYLKADIEAAATRLLGEVHALALAYHWSERDILALPPMRRRFYLECLS